MKTEKLSYVREQNIKQIELKNNTLTMINITINADYDHIHTYSKEDLT